MHIITITCFHHGDKFVQGKSDDSLAYIEENEVEFVNIYKDHFLLTELLYYLRDFEYGNVGGFCFKDSITKNFILVESILDLVNLVKVVTDSDVLDLYVKHFMVEAEVNDGVPTGYHCRPTVDESVNEREAENSHGKI